VSHAKSNGAAAATAIHHDVMLYLQQHRPELLRCRIVARVYADFEKLSNSKAASEDDIPEMMTALRHFAAGFSGARAQFDFTNLMNEGAVEDKISCK